MSGRCAALTHVLPVLDHNIRGGIFSNNLPSPPTYGLAWLITSPIEFTYGLACRLSCFGLNDASTRLHQLFEQIEYTAILQKEKCAFVVLPLWRSANVNENVSRQVTSGHVLFRAPHDKTPQNLDVTCSALGRARAHAGNIWDVTCCLVFLTPRYPFLFRPLPIASRPRVQSLLILGS
jgi:hypothetical protein